MLPDQLNPQDFPKVPMERRAGAFLIDFVTVWLVSSFAGGLQWLVFLVVWFALRVFLVEKNQGQSLGCWAMDLKILDLRYTRIPDLLPLAKREGIVGVAALLAMIGLNINVRNALSMLLLTLPLLIDCAVAFTDEQFNQAFHDRIAQTVIIPSRRGFSLDIRFRKLLAQVKYYLRQRRQ